VPPVRAQQVQLGAGARSRRPRKRSSRAPLRRSSPMETPAPCQAGHACGKRRRLAARRAVLVRHAYAEAACWHQLMRAPNSQWGSHEPNAQAWAGHVLRDRELLRVATAAAWRANWLRWRRGAAGVPALWRGILQSAFARSQQQMPESHQALQGLVGCGRCWGASPCPPQAARTDCCVVLLGRLWRFPETCTCHCQCGFINHSFGATWRRLFGAREMGPDRAVKGWSPTVAAPRIGFKNGARLADCSWAVRTRCYVYYIRGVLRPREAHPTRELRLPQYKHLQQFDHPLKWPGYALPAPCRFPATHLFCRCARRVARHDNMLRRWTALASRRDCRARWSGWCWHGVSHSELRVWPSLKPDTAAEDQGTNTCAATFKAPPNHVSAQSWKQVASPRERLHREWKQVASKQVASPRKRHPAWALRFCTSDRRRLKSMRQHVF